MLCPVSTTLSQIQLLLNPFTLQPSLSARLSGPSMTRSWKPCGLNLIHQEVLRDRYMCKLISVCPSWTQHIHHWALDTQQPAIPLKGLSTAFETAGTLFQQVFCHFGIPEDIIFVCGPLFISRVWNAFFQLLGVTVNLTSGYHLQSNSQTERKMQEIKRDTCGHIVMNIKTA